VAFDDDATVQIATIRTNLARCNQTVPPERVALSAIIDSAIGVATGGDVTLAHVQSLGAAVRKLVEHEGWYLLGAPAPVPIGTDTVYSARREDKLRKWLMRAVVASDPTLTTAESDVIAADLIANLCSAVTFLVAKTSENSTLPLHAPGFPMWLGIEDDRDPPLLDSIKHLPSRLGLQPDSLPGQRYVLLRLSPPAVCLRPRFADSGGYPYWRATGKTQPIETCPSHLPGIQEVVSDRLRISSLAEAAIVFHRAT